MKIISDREVADILIHETGHANEQCAIESLAPKEAKDCCAKSPSNNDVQGYCRTRNPLRKDFQGLVTVKIDPRLFF